MRVGVYAGAHHPIGPALCEGFAKQGAGSSLRCSAYYGGEVEDFDLVAVYGVRKGGEARAAYEAAGVPVLTCEWGYMARVNTHKDIPTGHFQVSLGGLNTPPAFPCPGDRFEALGIDIAARGGDPNGYVLLIGQVAGDAAHGMEAGGMADWLRRMAAQYPDVRYRPHPRGAVPLHRGVPLATGTLAEALAGARLVVTWNSNTGHDALLAGVPVVAHGPRAAYAELAGESLPPLDVRRAYFRRLAYGQWTLDEMRSGACQRFLLDHLIPGKPVELEARPAQPVRPSQKRRRRRGANH